MENLSANRVLAMVTVRYRALMWDDSGHEAKNGVEVLVFARIKSIGK
jgi:hypothetical protein